MFSNSISIEVTLDYTLQ